MRDRARARSFFRFLAKRFLDDRLFEAAGALSFTTVFALVPLSMVVFGVLSAFPVFGVWSDRLSDYVFANFVPSAARSVETYLKQFSAQRRSADHRRRGRAGGIAADHPQRHRDRLQPHLAREGATAQVRTLPRLLDGVHARRADGRGEPGDLRQVLCDVGVPDHGRHRAAGALLRLAPMSIEFVAIAAIYKVVPHRTIQWRHAVAGALLATIGVRSW